MATRLFRTQLLLERSQHEALRQIAAAEGRSVSDIVREIVDGELDRRQRAEDEDVARYLDGLARIREHREAILARRGGAALDVDPAELVATMRDEWDEQRRQVTDEHRR